MNYNRRFEIIKYSNGYKITIFDKDKYISDTNVYTNFTQVHDEFIKFFSNEIDEEITNIEQENEEYGN